jgi:hypothetical protein
LSEVALEKLEELNEEQIIALTEAALQERYARVDALCGSLDLDERGWARTDRGPLYWAQNHTMTENPKWKEQGVPFKARFPRKTYFQPLMGALMSEQRLFVCKTREMMASWAIVVYATHKAQWHQAETIVQTENEEKAKNLLKYAQILYDNQDDHLKALHPLKGSSQLSIEWQSGGRIFGIPAGESKIRMWHPTVYIQDEAAFLPDGQVCYDAAHPVAHQIVAVSSAAPGWFAEECQEQPEIEKPINMEQILKNVANRYPYPIDRQHCY